MSNLRLITEILWPNKLSEILVKYNSKGHLPQRTLPCTASYALLWGRRRHGLAAPPSPSPGLLQWLRRHPSMIKALHCLQSPAPLTEINGNLGSFLPIAIWQVLQGPSVFLLQSCLCSQFSECAMFSQHCTERCSATCDGGAH